LNRINRLQLLVFQFGKTPFDNSFVFNNRIFQLLIRILEEYVGIKYGDSSFAGTALIIFTGKSAFAPIWSNCTILSEFDQIVN